MALLSVTEHRDSACPAPAPPALDSADPEVRRAAALARRGDDAAVPDLLTALGREPHLAARQAMFDALVSIGGQAVARGVADLLGGEDAHLRNEAITALSEMPAAVESLLDDMLCSSDPDIRIFTVNILRDLRHPRAVEWLGAVILHDDHPNVVGTALDHALELSVPDFKGVVEGARERFSDNAYIRFVCGMILDRIAEGEA